MQVAVLVDAHEGGDWHVVLLSCLNRPFHLRDVLVIFCDKKVHSAFLEGAALLVELLLHRCLCCAAQERRRLTNAPRNEAPELVNSPACELATLSVDLRHAPLGGRFVPPVSKLVLACVKGKHLVHVAASVGELPVYV